MHSAPINRAAVIVFNRCCATRVSTVGTPVGRGRTMVGASDGLSNTIGFMEYNGGFLGTGWTGMNFGQAMFFSNFGTCTDRTNGNCAFSANGKGYSWGTPSSAHTNNRRLRAGGRRCRAPTPALTRTSAGLRATKSGVGSAD